MGFELWGAAAASTSVAAVTVFRTAKNKKNDQRLRSSAGSRINSTSPPPLSATLDSDPGTITILTTPNPQIGRGKDAGLAGDGQGGLVGKWLGHFCTAETRPLLRLAFVFFPVFLLGMCLIRCSRINWHLVGKEIRIWTWLAFICPFVSLRRLWVHLHPVAHTSEGALQTGITNRGIGGITLVSGQEDAEGKVGESQPRKPGKVGPGGGGKKSNQKRQWKAVENQFHDFVSTLTAIITFVRVHLGTLAAWAIPPWVVKFFDGIGRNLGSQQQSSGTNVPSLVGDTGDSAPGLDNKGGRKTGKETPKKPGFSGYLRKKNGGGKKKKRRK